MKIENFISYEQPTNYIVHSDQYTKDGQIPVLTAGQSFVLGYTDEEDGIYTGEPVVIFDDFTTSVQYVDFPFKVKSSAMKILKNKQNANIKFCYYLLSWLQKMPPNHKRQWISTTSQIDVNLPPIEWQKKIVQKIEAVSNIIKYRKEELKKLDELVSARFVEMFGDPVSNEYGLSEATLPELGEFGRGVSKHRPRNDPKLLGGEYPLVQTGDVANAGLYITSYSSTYSELGLMQSKMWDKGTLCITIAANIAKTAILEFDACFPDSIVGFNANEKINNIFIHYWFSFFQAILESQAPESAQKNINLKILSELKVIVPEKDKQDEFVEFIKQVDKSKVVVSANIVYNIKRQKPNL